MIRDGLEAGRRSAGGGPRGEFGREDGGRENGVCWETEEDGERVRSGGGEESDVEVDVVLEPVRV